MTAAGVGTGVDPVLRVGRHVYPVVLPRVDDARLHVASVIIAIHILGQVALDFRVSVPQILAAILTGAAMEVVVTLWRHRRIVWPASAMLTGSGVALILRDVGTEVGDHWSTRRWWLFAAVSCFSLATKYLVRWRGTHVFNPSNVGLVIVFLVLGSARIEPLDFWWAPLEADMVLAYWLIVVGGVLITARLALFEMAAAFWLTFAACLGSLALAGHCITAAWSLSPVCDGRFWWTVVTSPETLVFLFFMITDPQTVPSGRGSRIVFGVAVGVASALLVAPQRTEFGAKVALLAGLVVVCAARPVVGIVAPRFAGLGARDTGAAATVPARLARPVPVALAVTAAVVVLAGVAAAGSPARLPLTTIETEALPDPRALVPDVDPTRLPPVITADPEVSGFGEDLTGDGGRLVGIELVRALDVEAMAILARDASLLEGVDHGARLAETTSWISAAGSDPIVVPHYTFDTMHLVVGLAGGQGGARLTVEGSGRVTQVTHRRDGSEVSRTTSDFALVFTLRAGSDGRWLVAAVTPLP